MVISKTESVNILYIKSVMLGSYIMGGVSKGAK